MHVLTEHIVEIALMLVIIWFIMQNSRQGFVADPFGTGLRYYTFQSSSASGPGSNAYLSAGGM